jgi:diguanylate cyclase (GGDEF)-like protein
MGTKPVQRGIVVALILAAIGGALAAHLVSDHQLQQRRAEQATTAQKGIGAALRRRAFFLEDLADMVGVHDDADVAEFTRYAHIRGRDENNVGAAVVGVQWVRHSPSGRLVPAGDVPAGTKIATPVLFRPAQEGNAPLVDAAAQAAAAEAIRTASIRKKVSLSAPLPLTNGDPGFYLAVPVEAHRFSGDLSRLESRSAMVGLIDARALVSQAFGGDPPAGLRLTGAGALLAAIGDVPTNPVSANVSEYGRTWNVVLSGSTSSASVRILPWALLLLGLGIASVVAVVLGQSSRRRDTALDLAEQARAEAERRSREDALTGIFNRRHFGEVLTDELARAGMGDEPAVLLLDVDHFKSINDLHGHLAGDSALQTVASRIDSVIRGPDCLARWGGEEFAILAPRLDRAGAIALAERARAAVSGDPVMIDGAEISITLSVGAALVEDGLRTPDELVDAADQALYEAKREGRNRVRVWNSSGTPAATPSRA